MYLAQVSKITGIESKTRTTSHPPLLTLHSSISVQRKGKIDKIYGICIVLSNMVFMRIFEIFFGI